MISVWKLQVNSVKISRTIAVDVMGLIGVLDLQLKEISYLKLSEEVIYFLFF